MQAEQLEIAAELAEFVHDPQSAILVGFPWGEAESELECFTGPRAWQGEVNAYIGSHLGNPTTRHQPCRIAISSGHGIGKTAEIAMIAWWAVTTFEDTRVNITANTDNQLKTKTSPELAKWFRIAANSDCWDKTVTGIKIRDPKHYETWRCDLVPWSEDNPAAAAGLHNKRKRIVFIIDEASEIPQIIFDTMEGVLLDEDTEIIVLVFGNATRNKGPFYDIVFGSRRHRWKTWTIDSRTVEGTNKVQLAEWEQDYGEDSDFFRVRARGLPPVAESAQFIDQDLIDAAQRRKVIVLPDEPLVAGVDFAWGGADDNVIRFRCGLDAASVKPIKIKGEFTRDPAVLTGKLADILGATYVVGGIPRKLAMLFLDSAGIAAPVESRLRQLGHQNIVTINFGAHSPSERCAFMRDYIWQRMKEWLRDGAIDNDPGLASDLAKPVLVSDKLNRVKLESKELMKKRLGKLGLERCSPDDADALALTFAMTIAPAIQSVAPPPKPKSVWG
jgi:hypothetical protein